MIQRINFFKANEKGLTYGQMTKISVGLVVLLFLLVTWQKHKLGQAQQSFQQIQTKLQQHKQQQAKLQEQQAPIYTVANVLHREPAWPKLLSTISNSLVEGVWLTKITGKKEKEVSEILLEGVWLTKITGKKEKEVSEILLEGTAHQAASVPQLMTRLKQSGSFSRVQLVSTQSGKQEALGAYQFKVKGVVR